MEISPGCGVPVAQGSAEELANAESAVWQTASVDLGETAVVGSFNHLRTTVKQNAQELDFATQDALIADIAAGLSIEAAAGDAPLTGAELEVAERGRAARKQLVASFLERVVNIAHWNSRRLERWDIHFREETLQAGFYGLASSVVAYARLPAEQRRAFWPYAQKTITSLVKGVSRELIVGKTLKRDDHTEPLSRYFAARKELLEANGRTPSISEIAEIMDIPFEQVYFLHQVSTPDHNLDLLMSNDGFVRPTTPKPGNTQAEILVERALLFLSPHRQQMIRMRFGIGDTPQLGTVEIAKKLNTYNSSVSTSFLEDKQWLAIIVDGLVQGTINTEAVRLNPSLEGRNVVTLFQLLGATLPEDARLPELRAQATQLLHQAITDERQRAVMARLYNLSGWDAGKSQRELAKELGMSPANLRLIEKKVLAKLAEKQPEN